MNAISDIKLRPVISLLKIQKEESAKEENYEEDSHETHLRKTMAQEVHQI